MNADRESLPRQSAWKWSAFRARILVGALAIVGALPAILAVWFALFAHLERRESAAITGAAAANVNLTRAFSEHVLGIVKVIDYQSSLIAAELERKGVKNVDLAAARRHLVISLPFLIQVSMIDAAGNLSSSSLPFTPTYLGDREHFRALAVADTKKLYIGKPVLARTTGKWSIPMSRRLNAANGTFAGVVVMLIDPEYFARYFSTVSLGEHGMVTLLRNDGTVISRRAGQSETYGTDLSAAPDIKVVMAQQAGVRTTEGYIDGRREVIAFDSLSDYPLKVLVGSSLDAVLAPVRADKPAIVGLGVALSAALLFAALIIASLVERLRQANRDLVRDLTERRQAEEARVRLATIVENSNDAIIGRNQDGVIVIWNAAAERLLGWTAAEAVGQELMQMFPPDEQARIAANRKQVRAGGTVSHEAVRITKDGRRIDVSIGVSPIKDDRGNVIGSAATIRDLTERKRAEERIRHVAHHDNLTGLPNRLLFNDRLGQAIVLAKRDSLRFALLYLDLDDFKPVNDTLGHDAGDELLKSCAERILRQVRDSDTVARVGGDEFTVILRDIISREDVAPVAEKLIAALTRPFHLESRNQSVQIGTSIGIAVYPIDAQDAETLIKVADASMYSAKKLGNCFRFCEA